MKHLCTKLILLSLLPLAACSNDDKSTPLAPISNKSYTDSSGLELYYNGNKMPGKTVVFNQDGEKATITAYSVFDLSQISGFGLKGELPSPGIIPGSPKVSWDVDLKNNGNSWVFKGTGDDTYATYNYEGSVNGDNLKLNIRDAKLKTGGITPSAWAPSPIIKNNDGSYKSLPLYTEWQYDPLPDVDINFAPILDALVTAPVIPVYNNTAYMSISEAISEILKVVSFLPDGNILFTYISSVGGAERIAQSYANGYQYVIAAPGIVKVYVNPLSFFSFILQTTSGSTPASEVDLNATGLWAVNNEKKEDSTSSNLAGIKELLSSPIVQKILKNIVPEVLPMVSEGIPFAYSITSGQSEAEQNLKVFINTEMTVKIMTAILTPILEDSVTIEALKQYMQSSPLLSPLIPEIEKALTLLPNVFERTTTFNLGFNFIPYTSK